MANLIVTCMFKYKRTCGVTRCSLARCAGCIWSRVSRKRISKAEMQRRKNIAEMFYTCESKDNGSDLVLVKVKKGENHGNETKSNLQTSRH